jgi:preflagellin peptidase FlaK
MFLGFPVDGERISEAYGFVMEEIAEDDGRIHRRFLGITEALRGMMSGTGRIYTLDLRRHPLEYAVERARYAKAGKVWISYGVPFIVPITAGLISALLIGDLIVGLLGVLYGV